ncbi:hypothetical protein N9545_01930 [Salibacteraceae bacterium]|jgi:uncharacterized damage-inducible protein DinB|nr:hypothetical protein [Salibacteraceae bacterium]MDB4104265.1 hypothetical protein [Salibacteraceae bacterium]MDB9710055.1 hypothetical protein [Salibacteraceae bacterium]HAQ69886.1 hypothetical protein [Flavobacteriales bacterium]
MNYLRQFQYNEEIIGRYIDVLNDHPESPEMVKSQISHLLNALDMWVNRIEGSQSNTDVWQVHKPAQLHDLNQKCHNAIFHLLEIGNLRKLHTYENSKGETYRNTLDEVLTHLIIHSAHHRAQISMAWSEVEITPPVCDFIFWARDKNR